MATPVSLMEDQADDFFDKLVDDELAVNDSSTSGLKEGGDSYGNKHGQSAVSSVANLSFSESESLSKVATEEAAIGKAGSYEIENTVDLGRDKDRQLAGVSDSTLTHESKVESVDLAVHGVDSNKSGLEFSFGKSSRPAQASVKEVQWSSFLTDNDDNDLGGFGSYSDFFTPDNHTAGQAGQEQNSKLSLMSSKTDTNYIHEKRHQDEATSAGQYSYPSDVAGNSYRSYSQKEVAENDTNNWESAYKADAQSYNASATQTADVQLEHSSEYWEKLYPGWKYDLVTGEWHQIDGYNADALSSHTNVVDKLENSQENGLLNATGSNALLNYGSEISYLQQPSESVVGTVSDNCTTERLSNWNQPSQCNAGHPSHMLFYEQYPGWYFDTKTQQWHQLDVQFDQSMQMVDGNFEQVYDQRIHGNGASHGNALADTGSTTISHELRQMEEYPEQEQGSGWTESVTSYIHKDQSPSSPEHEVLYSEQGSSGGASEKVSAYQQTIEYFLPQVNNHESTWDMKFYADQRVNFKTSETVFSYKQSYNSYESNAVRARHQNLSFSKDTYGFDPPNVVQDHQTHCSPAYYSNQYPKNHLQAGDLSYASASPDSFQGRTSAGRHLHALVTFGFGGKLVVMKVNYPFNRSPTLENQNPVGGVISVHNLMDLMMDKSGVGSYGSSGHDYFYALCQHSLPGPLVGGNVANKDVHKWVDERIAFCGSHNVDYRKGESLRLLLSLLKISCLHYGKLRSPFSIEAASQENDGPESAVTKLLTSSRRNATQLSEYDSCTQCLQPLPSEEQLRSTAIEMQKLLVAGRRSEALQCAQEGQLWGPALILAGKLGEKFYVETVKQLTHRQLRSGSPLRTLCLLISGQLADVFSSDSTVSPRPATFSSSQLPAQTCASGMLDDWEENLAIITANRMKDDELVIIHLGDCLWKEMGEVTAAHACYLVAEANFESLSDTARLCLIGADHWRSPRTYASPDAIQRTEVYEYAKVLGNSQFILQPFQPYKLIYAHMLAEVGKVSESFRYCQAILTQLKNAGHTADIETWKLLTSSLEERLRTHQQGGYASNLAPAKLMGKVLTSIDRSIHRIIGAPLPPLPPVTEGNIQNVGTDDGSAIPKISNETSRTGFTSLMPSASMEPISDRAGDNNRMSMHTRSISEPDIGRSPKQGQNAQVLSPSDAQSKTSSSGGPTRLGRFGSQLLQKAVGLVSRTRQAKLGETNKFYYDEKLKRWIEEGVVPPTEAAELAAPPTTAAFRNDAVKSPISLPNGVSKNRILLESDSSGIPPMPPSTNQFSARGRLGVRSRYVDTFNKGGGSAPACTFQSPSLPAATTGGGAAKFFIPIPTASAEADTDHSAGATGSENNLGPGANETSILSPTSSPPPPAPRLPSSLASSTLSSMGRIPSMDDITPASKGMHVPRNPVGLFPSHSRAASWSGSCTETLFNNTKFGERRLSTDMLASPPFFSSPPGRLLAVSNSMSMSTSVGPVGNFGDDLQEVEL